MFEQQTLKLYIFSGLAVRIYQTSQKYRFWNFKEGPGFAYGNID